jgi:hypothetical protein
VGSGVVDIDVPQDICILHSMQRLDLSGTNLKSGSTIDLDVKDLQNLDVRKDNCLCS